ncbi:hypothetical protein AHMF7616_03701 [Adhaeribacter pallidiroseus]|uniref:Uncharacterized protein n=1 Tax=Adhaeribacter pallidiroseus TaxID=2072847 RepID=A0A369QSD2_9BACT|nr:hypothetical protein AHMF7616_03701 [Adhaeribacter pallidiroseus]
MFVNYINVNILQVLENSMVMLVTKEEGHVYH